MESSEVFIANSKEIKPKTQAKLGEGKYLGCYAKGWEVENKVLKVLDVARRRQ
jgi:hypothetical protein